MHIESNGSKWAGQAPDSIETLIGILETETLEPTFERYGGFVTFDGTGLRASGNFRTVSHVFNISGSIEEMRPLTRAIKCARRRPEYRRLLAVNAALRRGEPVASNGVVGG